MKPIPRLVLLSRASLRSGQRGVTLIIGMIMLVLITLIVVNAFTLGSSDLKSVGNTQVRAEATAAANQAIEQLISTTFTTALGAQTFSVDINKDGTNDYSVAIATPTCLKSKVANTCSATDCGADPNCASSCQGGSCGTIVTASCGYSLTDWDIQATVTDVASGASVVVREGVRVPLLTTTATSVCP
jgi:Tfp pilus assembly protein PilX